MAKAKKTTKAATAKKAREARQAKAKGKVTAALKVLAKHAKEINVRLEKAKKLSGNAQDHRLAAAIELDMARKAAKANRINFKAWCEENIDYSQSEIHRLAKVGGSDDPVKAIEDYREANVVKNKEYREKQKAAAKKAAKAAGPTVKGPKVTPADRVRQALEATDEQHAAKIVAAQAEKLGLAVVTAEEAKKAKAPAALVATATCGTIRRLFLQASEEEQTKVVAFIKAWVAGDADDAGDAGDDLLDIPEFLQRKDNGKAKKGSRRKAA